MNKVLTIIDKEFLYGFCTGIVLGIAMTILKQLIQSIKFNPDKGNITAEAITKIKNLCQFIYDNLSSEAQS